MPANADRTFTEEMAGAVRAWFGKKNKRAGHLAEALRISRPTAYSRWHGKTPYSNEEIDSISDYLGVSPYDIIQTARQMSAPAPAVEPVPEVEVDLYAQPARAKRGAA